MKNLKSLNLGKSLNRAEMKSISAGYIRNCDSVCSENWECQIKRRDSYCTYVMCEGRQRYSCQWINDYSF